VVIPRRITVPLDLLALVGLGLFFYKRRNNRRAEKT
jgi:hypothetical protein